MVLNLQLVSICLLALVVLISFEVYHLFRKRYEVLGVSLDPVRGMVAESEKFRTRMQAEKCYKKCQKYYTTVCIIER